MVIRVIDQFNLPSGFGLIIQGNNDVNPGDQLVDEQGNVATITDRSFQSVKADKAKIVTVMIDRKVSGKQLKLN
ncbi:hypothetical protein [uncultured Limosilactobacillus sp.]|uniref:hypothetical protein n=1 Tax=uncultured Limosilactobacillus sp. TaxID=2837629 RepID=UPI0025FDC715|nr:hypothetical protein [uncultured Limosilactobacillus sp.]